MGATSRVGSAPVRCIGDPYGVGCDCLAPANGFILGALPGYESEPIIVAVPHCAMHADLVHDWVMQSTPLPQDVAGFAIDVLPDVQAYMRRELGSDLWLYTHAA